MKRSVNRGFVLLLLLVMVVAGAACDGDSGTASTPGAACDAWTTPIVFAHGFLEVGDAFANQSMRFAANGYCQSRIYAFDWNTLGGRDDEVLRLTAFIDDVLDETGAGAVDLIGHSAGTGLSFSYLSEPENAAKVAHYANVAGFSADEPPGGVPTISLSSEDDLIVGISHVEGAENVEIPDLDHLQIITSAETFFQLYRFFNDGAEPATTDMEPTDEVILSGRLLSFGINQPAGGTEMRIYPFDPATGERLQPLPAATFVSDDEGNWGPFDAVAGQHYEYEVINSHPFWRPIHYYREPLPRSCDLVYCRTFPPVLSMVGMGLALLPYNDCHTLLATLIMNQAIVAGRDSFFVDGYELSTGDITPAEKTTIAAFFFDANGNGQSDAVAPGFLGGFPFIQIFDLYIEAEPDRPIPFVFNGRTMAVRNWMSDTEGIPIAVFE
ncbi:alpha/beta fold hydrolase [Thermodesulfobacteriota bacterium]